MRFLKPFELADCFLLDKVFQKISNSFQKLTDKTCFFLAKIIYLVSACFFVLVPVVHIYLYGNFRFIFLSVFYVPGLVYLLMTANRMDREENKTIENRGNFVNSARITLFPLRITMWIFLVLTWDMHRDNWERQYVAVTAILASTFLMVVATYFSSCTPLPPGNCKIKKWLESLSKAFGRKLKPAAAPAQS